MSTTKRLSPTARDAARERADAEVFREIRAEAQTRAEKTARLREARLARDGAVEDA